MFQELISKFVNCCVHNIWLASVSG